MLQRKFYNPKLFFLCLFVMFFLLLATIAHAEDLQVPSLLRITIEDNAIYTSGAGVSILVTAQDDTGVTGYFLSETFSDPDPALFTPVDQAINLSKTVSFTLSTGDESKTVYAWFKDAAGNISNVISDSITLDENAPFNAGLLINNESSSVSNSQVSLKLSAEDTIGIVGYYISEYSGTPKKDQFKEIETTIALDMTISFTLSSNPGIKTLTAWFIDGGGNISTPVFKSVNFTYGWFSVFGTQEWEEANGIAIDGNGNTYIVGSTKGDLGGNENPSIDYSAFVTKISNTGEVLWTKLVGTTFSTRGNHIAVDNSGNVYIGGTYDESFDMMDAFVAKFNTNGTQQWLKIFESTYSNSVERIEGIGTDNSGNVYIAGYTNESVKLNDNSTVTYPSGYFLAKYDTNGTNLWGYEIFPNNSPDIHDVAVTDSGNIFITGSATSGLDNIEGKGGGDIFLAEFDTNGVKKRVQIFGTPYPDIGYHLAMDNDDNIYVSGITWGNLDTGEDSGVKPYKERFMGKFNSTGEKQWFTICPVDEEYVQYDTIEPDGITIDSRGCIYTAGHLDNTLSIHKYSTIGTKIWTKTLTTTLSTSRIRKARGMIIGPGDLLYVTGQTGSSNELFAGQQYPDGIEFFVWKSTTDSLLDITPPTGTITINKNTSITFSQTITLNLTAGDTIGIAGYYISESSSHPSPSDFTYISETQNFEKDIEYTFESDIKESKTVYAWYCDAFGNFSTKIPAYISFETESIAPVPGTLTINNGEESTASSTLTLKVTATDNIGITGYYISEGYETLTLDKFISVPPTTSYEGIFSYTLKDTSPGTVSINIWFRDAAGNFNTYDNCSKSTIKLEDTTPPTTIVSPPAGIYDTPQTVTLTCEDDDWCWSTMYSLNGEQPTTLYDTPFEITPPAIIMVQSQDFYDNYEAVQILTYALGKTVSEPIQAGEVKSSPFEVVEGLTLNINFNLDQNSIPLSIQSINCSTPVALKSPDGEIYGSYEYTGNTLNILVAHPAQGTWTLEVDRSSCSMSATYEAIAHQVPDYGNLPGSVSSKDVVKYLQVITGSQPLGIDANNDVNNDKRIGPTEAILLLQRFSNLR